MCCELNSEPGYAFEVEFQKNSLQQFDLNKLYVSYYSQGLGKNKSLIIIKLIVSD